MRIHILEDTVQPYEALHQILVQGVRNYSSRRKVEKWGDVAKVGWVALHEDGVKELRRAV
jgi:hypothetical protein